MSDIYHSAFGHSGQKCSASSLLILVGAASFITLDPTGPFSKFTALPIQIFQWTSFPQEEFRNLAAAASLALLLLLTESALAAAGRTDRAPRWTASR